MKKLLTIMFVTALAGVSIPAARTERVARAAVDEVAGPPVLTKRLDQPESPPKVAVEIKIYEPAALLLYSQPRSVTQRVVTR